MPKLKLETLMTMQTLAVKGMPRSGISRLLEAMEGTVRYRLKRTVVGSVRSGSRQEPHASAVVAAIEHWRERGAAPLNLAALHDCPVTEHGYAGSLRSVHPTRRADAPWPEGVLRHA